ncbi:MAG: putative porin, partial [Verrucomicrobiae bacterium]|nr:putative porin [Verrucomicrobiae bacterium]
MSSLRHPRLTALFLSAFLTAPALAQDEETTAATTDLKDSLDPVLETPLPDNLPKPTETEQAVPSTEPSTNVTINLIHRLVAKGILTQAEAAEMIQQAEADAAAAQRAQEEAEIAALPPEPSAEEEMSINYIPEVVRNQMRDQIQQELMAQAREEQWGKNAAPDWTSKFRPFGDIRTRYEGIYFPDGNDNSGAFPNFNAINTGAPFDTSGTQFSPQYNVDQDRERARLRARIGTDIMLGQGVNGGIRLATGNDNSPTSTNQTMGGSGGNFSKYGIWLDRAFLSYDAGPGDGEELVFSIGRFDNPFFSTDLM